MRTSSIPLETFIHLIFERKEIKDITDKWRIDKEDIKKSVIGTFKELGLYSVGPDVENMIIGTVIEFLFNSPEIIKMVKEAEKRERMLAKVKKNLHD